MSAKPSKKSARPATTPSASVPAAAPTPLPSTATAAADSPPAVTAWIDSTDPRRRALGKAILAGIWLYVAALWLLALDQSFNWGLFGPKIPPLP